MLGTSSPRTRLQMMKNLKTIELVGCKGLTKISDLFRFPNLINLKVNSCGSLDEVCVSVGVLKNLVNMDLGGNGVLGKFEIAEEMKSLKRLNLTGTAIKELSSSSIGCLINFEELILLSCKNLTDVPCSIFELQHLQHLNLSGCINLVTFPTQSESNWRRSLHDKYYDPLSVNLGKCKRLVEVSEFAREIYSLNMSRCPLLRRVSKLCNILEGKESKMWPRTNLYCCHLLCDNLASEVAKMKNNLPDDSAVTALLSLFLSCRQSGFEVTFPGNKYPEWFTCHTGFERFPWPKDINITGIQVYKFKIEFPENFNWENKGLAFCIQSDLDSVFSGVFFRFRAIYINGVCIESTMWDDVQFGEGVAWSCVVVLHSIPYNNNEAR
ncbi:hypothetical protein M0R45_031171 [Rubus argutus]|uniref:Leucine-rich repeat domain, L domain-containing protein n=1 Tax=Rubus argutus TaxID=59490 RepID=A0AAW1WDW4_RUBAR